ncbi:lysozyme [Basfia succiniciproducens]|uniref:lysozyme n=1 Tax=Basfia succiniciproducens TaxID=653940 RepID=UPI003FCE8501
MKKTLIKYACSVAAIIALVTVNYGDQIRTTERGLKIIGNAEGCVRMPYKCPADYLTYGIGTAETSGEKIIKGKIYTDAEIAESWVRNIKTAEACVNRYANGADLPQGAFEAATSITFNAGCTTMRKSTLFKYAQQGNINAMCGQFKRWIYASGKVLPGLVKRRQQETDLCLAF